MRTLKQEEVYRNEYRDFSDALLFLWQTPARIHCMTAFPLNLRMRGCRAEVSGQISRFYNAQRYQAA